MERLGTFANPSQAVSNRRQNNSCSPEKAVDLASILIGCYRTGDAADPVVYARALVAMLSSYPEEIAIRVTDPRTGLPGQSKWLPTIFEVRHACEVEMQPIRDAHRRQNERAAAERVLADNGEQRERRKSFAELRERFPDVVGKSGYTPPLTETEKARIVADLAARLSEFRAPLVVSDELRAKIAASTINPEQEREAG